MNTEQLAVNTAINHIVKRYIHNSIDQLDVKQNIYLCLCESYPNYKETGHLLAWSCKIAEHKCLDYIRDNAKETRRQNDLVEDVDETDANDVDLVLIEKELLYYFRQQLQKRIVKDRETLVLIAYFVDHKSKLSIATEYGMSRKVVARIIEKAYQFLRDTFQAIYDGTYRCVNQIKTYKM